MRLPAAFAFAVAFSFGVSSSHAEKRVALVIGNGAYVSAPRLSNPRNDAEDVAAALKRAGFDTIVGLDLGRAAMDDAAIRFAREVRDADVALLYYSGHALQFAGINYLMPVDAKLTDEADLRRLMRVDDIVADLQRARALRILVLDSCRDNPLAEELKRSIGLSRAASMQRGLARIDTAQGMIVAFATQAGSTAADGSGRNSPYTAAFLHQIETQEEIGTVFRRITADVYQATKHAQLPELSMSLIGEFYLHGAALTSPVTAGAVPGEAERTWPFVKDTTSIAVLDDFIARYGDTIYATMARVRRDELKKLEAANQPPPVQSVSHEPVVTSVESPDAAATKPDRSWLGVTIKRVTEEIAENLSLKPPRGAFIVSALDYGPANAAGLQSGDVVIRFDGKDIKEVADLPRSTVETPAGKEVEIVILRNGKAENHTIKPANESEAVRKAAAAGNPGAMNHLGNLYREGRGVAKNETAAVTWYRKAADAGNAFAMNSLGLTYATGRGVAKDEAEATRWYRKAMDAGEPNGMSTLGDLYREGKGVPKDDAEAVNWYRRAADAGNAFGMNGLGIMYQNGRGVAKDEGEAVRWYRKAADAGNALGMLNLGYMYDAGRGVAKDDAEAMRWYRKAADSGNARAMGNVAVLYAAGRGATKDDAEAVRWYRKAADANDQIGMSNLGNMYRDGRGVPRDDALAAAWYRKAAEAGNALGMDNLAFMYATGRGLAKDEAEAFRWYRKAADAGNAHAMNNVGFMSERGQGVAKNETEAASWYRKAADARNTIAMINLGIMYRDGRGVAKDAAEAVRWYRKAADAGEATGMNNLGMMYERGQGVAKDEAEAARWYRKAADARVADAMTNLGSLYASGRGVSKDDAEAVRWFQKAADAGSSLGMVNLAAMYRDGKGVAKNQTEALRLFRKAADGGGAAATIAKAALEKLGQ